MGTGACVTEYSVTSDASSKPSTAKIAGRSTVSMTRRTPRGLELRVTSRPPMQGTRSVQRRHAAPIRRPAIRNVEVLRDDLTCDRRRDRSAVAGAFDDERTGDLWIVVRCEEDEPGVAVDLARRLGRAGLAGDENRIG